jgi:hypothetical protein
MLRMAIIMALMLLAPAVYASSGSVGIDILGSNVGNTVIAAGAGNVKMDILGSKMGNAQIFSDRGVSADIEVIGGKAGNISIVSKKPIIKKSCCCCDPWCDFKRPLCYPYSSYIPARYNTGCYNTGCYNSGGYDKGCYNTGCYPFNQSQHFGVDAWHGCYWYSPIYLPQWPQL